MHIMSARKHTHQHPLTRPNWRGESTEKQAKWKKKRDDQWSGRILLVCQLQQQTGTQKCFLPPHCLLQAIKWTEPLYSYDRCGELWCINNNLSIVFKQRGCFFCNLFFQTWVFLLLFLILLNCFILCQYFECHSIAEVFFFITNCSTPVI